MATSQVQSGGDVIEEKDVSITESITSARVAELETELQMAKENLIKVQWIWILLSMFEG